MNVGAWLDEAGRSSDAALRQLRAIAEPIARAAARRAGLRSPAEDDILEEVLIASWVDDFRALRRVRPGCQLRSWLVVVCRYAAVGVVRDRMGRRPPCADAPVPCQNASTAAARAMFQKHLAWLERLPGSAIASLPPRQAQVVRMVLEGSSGPDICRALGITKRAERNLLLRGWERLRRRGP